MVSTHGSVVPLAMFYHQQFPLKVIFAQVHLGIGGNIVETAALIGIANCLYLIDRVLQQLNVTEGYRET